MVDDDQIDGNAGFGGGLVDLTHSIVTGNATFVDSEGPTEPGVDPQEGVRTCGTFFRQSVFVRDEATRVYLGGSTACDGVLPIVVHGNVQLDSNHGPVHLSARIGGSLLCRDNSVLPVVGHPTSARLGLRVGRGPYRQCASLPIVGR